MTKHEEIQEIRKIIDAIEGNEMDVAVVNYAGQAVIKLATYLHKHHPVGWAEAVNTMREQLLHLAGKFLRED